MQKIYLDNAATSFPKPPSVLEAINEYFSDIGASPSRGNYSLGLLANREIFNARELLSKFFNCDNSANVIFTMNITHALNLVLFSTLNAGDHVITSGLEHNSVARPLEALKNNSGIKYTIVNPSDEGFVDPYDIKKAITPKTRMIALTHASNVFGTVQPAQEIGEIAHEYNLLYLLDTAQTAGFLPIDMKALHINYLAFTGHKSLLGPPGIGGVCLDSKATKQIRFGPLGGTGSKSHLLTQPIDLPDRLEAGTPNTPGIMGLKASIDFILETGIEVIRDHKVRLLNNFLAGCKELNKVKLYCANDIKRQTACISLNIQNLDGGHLSYILDKNYGIMTRSGLHCSPLAHQSIGTFPEGTVRFSFGWFNTEDEVSATLNALKDIIYN
jgi:cysteine desulfurase family protein